MNPKITIESLSMDLFRVALGLHRGSFSMVERFNQEALKRGQELEPILKSDPYAKKLIINTKQALKNRSSDKAEELLMYSVLFKNLAQFKYPT